MDKDFDFTTAKPVSQVPALQQLRKAYQESKQDNLGFIAPQQDNDKFLSQFDNDVKEAVIKHSTPNDRERLNTMIRVLFATA